MAFKITLDGFMAGLPADLTGVMVIDVEDLAEYDSRCRSSWASPDELIPWEVDMECDNREKRKRKERRKKRIDDRKV